MTRTNIFVMGQGGGGGEEEYSIELGSLPFRSIKVILQNYDIRKGLSNKLGQKNLPPIASVIR